MLFNSTTRAEWAVNWRNDQMAKAVLYVWLKEVVVTTKQSCEMLPSSLQCQEPPESCMCWSKRNSRVLQKSKYLRVEVVHRDRLSSSSHSSRRVASSSTAATFSSPSFFLTPTNCWRWQQASSALPQKQASTAFLLLLIQTLAALDNINPSDTC